MRASFLAIVFVLLTMSAGRADDLPSKISFAGPDGTMLVGYLFQPADAAGRRPAVVLMHGRLGPYSTRAGGVYDATTLSKRHLMWGRIWAGEGYVALLVDGFGPRGYPAGFPAHSYKDRPEAVNEVTVRPRDANAALRYLRGRPDVDPARVALMGWSNGASATLATMADLIQAASSPRSGFRGALAFYPGCGLRHHFDAGYTPYAPVRIFSGDADEEVSADRCRRLVDASRARGGDIAITLYPGATHGFDDPGRKRRSDPANVTATADAVPRARAFLRELFRR